MKRELWSAQNYTYTSPRDHYWRDCTQGLKMVDDEPIAARIISGAVFVATLAAVFAYLWM